MKLETCLLAHTFKQNKHTVNGSYLSEKLDGMRCLWIPFTRGMKKKDVPFANNAKDDRLIHEEICTGLWSRYSNVIHAPDWWLDDMPNVILDGELYSTTLPRQDLMSIVKKKNHKVDDLAWSEVDFFAFAMPHYTMLFQDGHIYNANIDIYRKGVIDWARKYIPDLDYHSKDPLIFRQEVTLLNRHCGGNAIVLGQEKLPIGEEKAMARLMDFLDEVTDGGGEGVMTRSSYHTWSPRRSHELIKFKKLQDSEATVMGYTTGKITEKDSKHRGRMGALTVETDAGVRFELSGFTDAERELDSDRAKQWAWDHPDSVLASEHHCKAFPRGTRITFRYRGVSKDGVPNEARYWRKR